MRVLLQFPEGLKQKALEIAEELEKKGDKVFLSASACYGACDIAFGQAEAVHADKIVHYGHARFPIPRGRKIAVEFLEWRSDADLEPVLGMALGDADFRKCKKIGLVTTVQHIGQMSAVRRFLEASGKKALVGRHGPLAKYDGQILGCDPGSATSIDGKVDCILYFGGGLFHPIAAAIACKRRVLAADPFSGRILWLDGEKKKYEKRKMGMLALGLQARRFGILVSTKPGQLNLRAAEALKRRLEAAGKEAAILVADRLEPEALENFHSFDFFVNTACPRIAVDDYAQFGKPVLNLAEAVELASLLGKRK